MNWVRIPWLRYAPVMAILGAFLWSSATVVLRRRDEAPPDAITLRIAHWQLEAGVQEAFNEMAEEYRRHNPRVRVAQEAIPESVYGQWVTTQLIGGNAPDMIEIGIGLPWPIYLSYFNRYFVPLTRYANMPNPHNEGTELEGMPLRQTYRDGMRQGYVPELQEFMTIPLSMFGVRMFYNRDLLRELTGLEEPPMEYRAFLELCEEISRHETPEGDAYIPIAGSRFQLGLLEPFMFDPITFSVLYKADYNRDGYVSNVELYAAIRSGDLGWDDPAIRARFRMTREVTSFFQPGFMGLTRDEAVFLFAQQRALFFVTGTWDAHSLVEQAGDAFSIGIMGFPEPRRDDPVYGDLFMGTRYELPMMGFPFAISRSSPHFEEALDFLLFLAGREGNEQLNQIIGWLPSAMGAETDEFLAAFSPRLDGIYGVVNNHNLAIGGETFIRYQQLYSLFLIGEIDYDELVEQYEDFYLEQGIRDWEEATQDWRRGMVKDSLLLADVRSRAMRADGDRSLSYWIRYRNMSWGRLIGVEFGRQFASRLVSEGRLPDDPPPYEYTPEALERIREAVAASMEASGEPAPSRVAGGG